MTWAVVTGGTSGIGRELALELAKSGRDVAVSHLPGDERARDLGRAIDALGRKSCVLPGDAGVRDDVERFFDSAQAVFGEAPQVVVNNAGIQTWSSLVQLEESDWDMVLRTNLKGCFLNTQKAARLMISAGQRGAIINIGSGSGSLPFPNLIGYSASKAGINQLTRSAALELGPHGITVNCVAPGAIEVERTRHEMPDYARSWSSITPMRRIGTATDVANAVLFLASEASSFITGQVIGVDGGVFTVPNWAD